MAFSNQDDSSDEFFGNDNSNTDALAAADTLALQDQYRTHGFHETFESSEEAHLQQGFEAGYANRFDQAQRIGQQLGALTVVCKTTNQRQDHLVAANALRNVWKQAVVAADNDTNTQEENGAWDALETQLEQMYQACKAETTTTDTETATATGATP